MVREDVGAHKCFIPVLSDHIMYAPSVIQM